MNKLFLVLFLSLFILGCTTAKTDVTTGTQTNGDGASSGEGRAVFAVTDAAADMGSVSSVMVTVDSVEVHSETEGWITVSSTSKTYDLLELKAEGRQELLADATLDEGTYNQLRLDVSSVVVVDEDGSHDAKLPSNELKMNGNFVVESGQTSTATFDFIVDESLHIAGNAKNDTKGRSYILAPVIQFETRSNAEVDVSSSSDVKVSGGKVDTNVKLGMDIKGNVGAGLKIPADTDLVLGSNGLLSIGGNAQGNAGLGGALDY